MKTIRVYVTRDIRKAGRWNLTICTLDDRNVSGITLDTVDVHSASRSVLRSIVELRLSLSGDGQWDTITNDSEQWRAAGEPFHVGRRES